MTELSLLWRAFRVRTPAERARLLRTAWYWLRAEGPRGLVARLRNGAGRMHDSGADPRHYAEWCRRHTPDAARLQAMGQASLAFSRQPVISILTPVYNTDPRWLEACAASVVAQVYPHWQWHVADDGSTEPSTRAALERITALDARIAVHTLSANGGISAATNVALAAAAGEYIALLDHDDALLPHALFRVVEHLNAVDEPPDVVYTDEDKLEPDGTRSDAYFKPDWSPDHFLSNMYACHLLVARRRLVEEVGGFRSAFDFSQDYDLVLRLMERANRIDHVADVVYHWRKVPQSTASSGGAKPTAHLAGQRALQDYLDRSGIAGHVDDAGTSGFYRIVFDLPAPPPAVTILGVPAGEARERLRASTAYERLAFADAAESAGGDVVVWMDPACEPASPDWLEALVQLAMRPGVGAVGPKVLRADGTLEHIGVVLGLGGVAGRPLAGAPGGFGGYFGNALLIRTVGAVGGSCVATRRDVVSRVGGLDGGLGREAAAVDYCLRVREAGERVVFTPWSVLRRREAAPVPAVDAADADRLSARWGDALARDPFYNPHLSRRFLDYRVGL